METDSVKVGVGFWRVVPFVKALLDKLEGVRRRWPTTVLHPVRHPGLVVELSVARSGQSTSCRALDKNK